MEDQTETASVKSDALAQQDEAELNSFKDNQLIPEESSADLSKEEDPSAPHRATISLTLAIAYPKRK